MNEIYTPPNTLSHKVKRKLSRYLNRRVMTPKLSQPIVSFTFDDCPRSVYETALPMLEKEGWRSTIYMACGLWDTTNHLGLHMSANDTKSAYNAGHEIADHTFSHLDIAESNLRDYQADIAKNQTALGELGIPPSRNFAYPYGSVTPELKHALYAQFETSRGVVTAKNARMDEGLLPATRLYSGTAIVIAKQRLKMLTSSPRWEILFTHDVRDNPSDYGCTPDEFASIVMAVKDSGARVMTVAGALDFMRASA